MFENLNPLKLLEQLSPVEKLIGILLTIVSLLLPNILEQFSSENTKFLVLISVILIILSAAIFASHRNRNVQEVLEDNKKLTKTRKELDEELRERRRRERELLRRESGSLTNIARKLESIRSQLNESLCKRETDTQGVLIINNQITPLIIEIQARVEHTDRRLRELADVEGILGVDDEADDEMKTYVDQQNKLRSTNSR
ncbi:MAG: hypothetical protein HC840_16195 [Leptolyngbyaceae cyanobacterium RM2_2_4]|nr:hypothetical protein [Leptolyngbyaceae cyanobacterium SM1_4_3]NJN89893.1 hypothetical protein [Leptolyngbyaceae cyanobacterium SL_5_14]NJO50725.1 hypothetical protein [Leptolyngbyaceae cyanobacterium RM2_2_4]NJO66571.1 hypothetical protein [Leptolyngbyaceae cyanobacterium RM1_405_57]